MKIFYTTSHQQHDPPFEGYDANGVKPSFEKAERAQNVYTSLLKTTWADIVPPTDFGLEPILAVHSQRYVDYLRRAFQDWAVHSPVEGMAFIPGTYNIDHQTAISMSGIEQFGFFLMDTTVVITPGTFAAALNSAYAALSGAQALTHGEATAFALNRPAGATAISITLPLPLSGSVVWVRLLSWISTTMLGTARKISFTIAPMY
jgi:acetoin utilization deacetylase AcuC-like enzyme